MSNFTTPITYYLQEGRENLDKTLAIAFRAAKLHNIQKIVIFTAIGQGVRLAIENFSSLPDYKDIKLTAVTFPQGKEFTDEARKPVTVTISPEDAKLFADHGISIIRAHLPFDPIASHFRDRGVLGQDLSLVGDALNMFCGSMSLCVQAIVLACDAGVIGLGEHVIALSSDTAILAQATSTSRMLSGLIIREILCKPAILSIGRGEKASEFVGAQPSTSESKPLPEETVSTDKALPAKED